MTEEGVEVVSVAADADLVGRCGREHRIRRRELFMRSRRLNVGSGCDFLVWI